MQVTESEVTKVTISGADGLDSITAIFEDLGPKQGRFILECWGDCWSHYWGAMWDGYNVRQFFQRCGTDYIAGKCVGRATVIDYNKISKTIGESVGNEVEIMDHEDLMEQHYGENWRSNMPETLSTEYKYVCQIIEAVKLGLAQIAARAEQEAGK